MSFYGNSIIELNENIPEIDFETFMEAEELGIDIFDINNFDESFMQSQTIDNIKKKLTDIRDLKNQWAKVADKFVKHEWIFRYINPKQQEMLEKYYKMLTDEDTSYNDYKKAFKFICKFMGIPSDKVIIENLVFENNEKDPEKNKVSLKYSKGLAKVNVPDDIKLVHVSPANDIKELNPTFRSKVKGKYMYPTKRCFFTIAHKIKKSQAGLENQKLTTYETKNTYNTVYIDPTYAEFKSRSVYIETDKPIPVEKR